MHDRSGPYFFAAGLGSAGAAALNDKGAGKLAISVMGPLAYMLVLYRRVVFGEQKNADAAAMPDAYRSEDLLCVDSP